MLIIITASIICFILSSPVVSAAPKQYPPVALPGCRDRCGKFTIPYPFGLGDHCSRNVWFNLTCWDGAVLSQSRVYWSTFLIQSDPFTPSAVWQGRPEFSISQLTMKGSPTTPPNSITLTDSRAQLRASGNDLFATKTLDLRGTPFRLMAGRNALLVGGCTGSAVLIRNARNETLGGCATFCNGFSSAETNRTFGSCYGLGCCQSAIPDPLDYIQMTFLNLIRKQRVNVSRSDPKASAAVVDLSYLATKTVDRELTEFYGAPTLLQWSVDDLPIHSKEYANSSCVKDSDGGYICTCKWVYYEGNPYLPHGCRAIIECRKCPNNCISAGNNAFRCPVPLPPPPPSPPPSPPQTSVVSPKLVLGLGVSLATMFMLIIISGLYQLLKTRKQIKIKEENFKKNGGLLLQQQMRTGDGSIERTKIFTSSELEKATDSFNQNRVLGRGGQGTVYKGMLVDGTIVAIKKSKKVSEMQLGQFINEVVILSQVNHRNVVKLFGCCLEVEVPLLVYEYVPNGTLFQHIHSPSEDFPITWKMRMQIAIESAEALSYLHSSSSSPIYHRDVKTSNILLDEKYRAKVSDFGTSKTLSIDQTHVYTCIQGTFGYIDPEFMRSNQFTEKSDVYSFGIVLLELLTSKKPFYLENTEERKALALEFLAAIESSDLYNIVDPRVYEEAQEQEIKGVADLARRCLNLSGRERPTMKEVAMTLHMISSQKCGPNAFRQDFIAIDEISNNRVLTSDEGSLSHSSTFGPR